MRNFITIIGLIAVWGATLGLGACGVKPKELSPPSGEEAGRFPDVYPKDAKR